ncbi:acyltransferase [Ralstonia pickettii]|nr:acyltransferase [Ralstonia pickettii]MBB0097022.1 acyltransferase [Ralstonia pickettii]MBB0107008.1 acyltransferase [Ralstonia pickettii]MBB0127795.1 acyltransferase [Ralstonia pickettii]MBB0160708.1 acyltransferase [Ralstonia pickettii]
MKHIRGLDGLRAFAVLSVMLYHLGWPAFSLGWAGVPFFFVLSGFLITGILLDSKGESAGMFFGRFYLRRTLRIFPLYYLYLAVVFCWCAYHSVQTTGWGYYLVYIQNYYLGLTRWHVTPGQELGHTWSLAVEEQFYLLWPLLVFNLSTKHLKRVIGGMLMIAVGSRVVLHGDHWMVSFTPLTSNLDTLGMGALLAILARENRVEYEAASRKLLVAGAAFAGAVYLLADHHLTASDGLYMASLTILFGGIVSFVSARLIPALDWAPLSYIGRISYGLYIWHALTFQVLDASIYHEWIANPGPQWLDAMKIGLTFTVAIASFHLFEKPILKLKDQLALRGYQPRLSAFAFGSACILPRQNEATPRIEPSMIHTDSGTDGTGILASGKTK